MKKKEEKEADKIFDILAENLKLHIIRILGEAGQPVDDKGAENVLSNIGVHLMNKNKDIILK